MPFISSLLPLFLVLVLAPSSTAADAPPRPDPKPSASRLAEAYRKTKDPDARFWLVDALHSRVEADADEEALKTLLEASSDPKEDVRRRALAALKSWRSLPDEARRRWRGQVEAAAAQASKEKSGRVRESGESLMRALKAPPVSPAGPRSDRGRRNPRRAAVAAAVWAISFQLAALAWARLAASLLRQCGEKGALALDCLSDAMSRSEYLVFPLASAAALLPLVGTATAFALVYALAPAARPLSLRTWAACFGAVYFGCGLAAFVPAALLARRATRAGPAGALRSALSALRDLPGCVSLGLIVLVSWPAGLFVSGRAWSGPWGWLASTGAPLGGLLAAAESGRTGASWAAVLAQASRRPGPGAAAEWLARPFSQGPLLLLYLAAPAVFALSALPAQLVGAEPLGLFELFFVSDAGFAWIFGLWAAAMSVSVFVGFWLAAAAIYAARAVSA